jgi:hypothetical protein
VSRADGRVVNPETLSWDVPLVALAVLLLTVLLAIAMAPLSIVWRYRAGTARRLARGWIAAINTVGLAVSVAIFLLVAAVTTFWVPNALLYSVAGVLGGALLGLLGLAASRWEDRADGLHYTPNRWLVLALTGVVTSRMLYGLWRGYRAWGDTPPDQTWLAAAGAAGSMAAGAVILGYSLAYAAGVWRRALLDRRGRRAATAPRRGGPAAPTRTGPSSTRTRAASP